jgi:hypothetical protein
MHPDRLNTTNADEATTAAYAAISALQSFPAATQVAGAVLLTHIIAQTLRMTPSELFNKAARMEKDADTYYQRRIKALRDYCNGELR